MPKVESPWYDWRKAVFFLIGLLVVVVDQLSKRGIRSSLVEGESLPEKGFFRLTHLHNTGAAFGLFQNQAFLLTIIGLIGIVAVLLFSLFFYGAVSFGRLGKPALGLVLGGTLSNLIDRLRLGYVTDFIGIGIWPAFNLADSAIVVGVILLTYSWLFSARAKKY